MNRNIEQLLLNTHALCLDRIRNNINLSIDNFYEDDFLKIAIPAMYSSDLDDNLKINYSIDDLKKDLVELFVKKKPTQAVAESYELETWLDSSRRVNSENRFAAYKKLFIKEG